MWIVGVAVLLLVTTVLILPLGWGKRAVLDPPIWDVVHQATTYTGIANTLAGFSVASAVFLANLALSRHSEEFAAVMGLFLLAFVSYVGAGFVFATVPRASSGDPRGGSVNPQHIDLILGNAAFYVGIMVSWLALRPLLQAVELRSLADIFTWLLLFAVLAGALRMGLLLYRLLGVPLAAMVAMPVLGVAAALFYRGWLVAFVPALWPSDLSAGRPAALQGVLLVGVLNFVAAATAYLAQTLLLTVHGSTRLDRLVETFGSRAMLAYTQIVVTGVALLWAAVATL